MIVFIPGGALGANANADQVLGSLYLRLKYDTMHTMELFKRRNDCGTWLVD
jgi:hypothetical protein